MSKKVRQRSKSDSFWSRGTKSDHFFIRPSIIDMSLLSFYFYFNTNTCFHKICFAHLFHWHLDSSSRWSLLYCSRCRVGSALPPGSDVCSDYTRPKTSGRLELVRGKEYAFN